MVYGPRKDFIMVIETGVCISGSLVIVAIHPKTEERLATRHFRNRINVASNFAVWRNAAQVFANAEVMQQLLADVGKAFKASRWQNSVEIDLDSPVGWSGTDDVDRYRSDDLEDFIPGKREWNTAKRVKLDRTDLRAPATTILTIIYDIRRELEGPIMVTVRSMYPGYDIGELAGDITGREKCVFFDWDHPGVPL